MLARPIPKYHRPSKGDPANVARSLRDLGRHDLAELLESRIPCRPAPGPTPTPQPAPKG